MTDTAFFDGYTADDFLRDEMNFNSAEDVSNKALNNEAIVSNALSGDYKTSSPRFRSYKHETTETWIDGGFKHVAPQYPMNAELIDMSIGNDATCRSLQFMHLVFAESYRTRNPYLILKKKMVCDFLLATNNRMKKIVDKFCKHEATIGTHKLFSGSSVQKTTLVKSCTQTRKEIHIELSDEVFALLRAPKLYVHVSLADVRAMNSVHSISALPFFQLMMLTRRNDDVNKVQGWLQVSKSHDAVADLLNANGGPSANITPSQLRYRVQKACVDITKNASAISARLVHTQRKKITRKTREDINFELFAGAQEALYAPLPNEHRYSFRLKAIPKQLQVDPSEFVRLSVQMGYEANMTTAQLAHQAWMLYLLRTNNTTAACFIEFAKEMIERRSFISEGVTESEMSVAAEYYRNLNSMKDIKQPFEKPSIALASTELNDCFTKNIEDVLSSIDEDVFDEFVKSDFVFDEMTNHSPKVANIRIVNIDADEKVTSASDAPSKIQSWDDDPRWDDPRFDDPNYDNDELISEYENDDCNHNPTSSKTKIVNIDDGEDAGNAEQVFVAENIDRLVVASYDQLPDFGKEAFRLILDLQDDNTDNEYVFTKTVYERFNAYA